MNRKIPASSLVTIAFLGMVCLTLFLFIKYQEAQSVLNSTTSNSNQELQEVKDKVSRHFVLPSDEEPTLATVSEVEKLRNQDFFKKAENGDKVLIYTDSAKAILYRPRIDKIIEVAPISVEEASPQTPAPTSQSQIVPTDNSVTQQNTTVKIELRNGTSNPNIIEAMRSNISNQNVGVEIVSTGEAVNQNLEQTIVVAVNMNKQADIQKIALELGAEYRTQLLPDEEDTSADVVIFIGADYLEE